MLFDGSLSSFEKDILYTENRLSEWDITQDIIDLQGGLMLIWKMGKFSDGVKYDDLLARIRESSLDGRSAALHKEIKDLRPKLGIIEVRIREKQAYDRDEARRLCEQGKRILSDIEAITKEIQKIETEFDKRKNELSDERMKKERSSGMSCVIF